MTDGRIKRKPELLLPAGSLPVLKTAVRYGADAVYIGGNAFGLRAKAKNFTPDEMKEGIEYARKHGAKVYVTANIFAHNGDLQDAARYFRELSELRPDAVLIADPGMFLTAKENCPEIPIHISTQANTTNYESCRFWYELGASRIVTARELSISEIRELKEKIPTELEIESFVHGAMCISYSGRCLLSNYLNGRDSNRGLCTHPCRWKYTLMEETRPGEYMPVFENERGTYIMNSKDLCMVNHLPDLYEAGIDSFKIEGRMKTALYVASCARTYRMAMDDYERDPGVYSEKIDEYMRRISECTYREFTTGFFYGKPGREEQIYDSNTYIRNDTYIGTVEQIEEDGSLIFHQKNKFSAGEILEIMKPDGTDIKAEVTGIRGEDGEDVPSAPHPQELLRVFLDGEAEEGDVLRRREY